MLGTKYLSELVDVSALETGKLNVIMAPTGSGKTYFALQHIPSLVEDPIHEVVYLIDTINGKEQILQTYNAVPEYRGWSKEIIEDGLWFVADKNVVIITYAKFGYLCDRKPEFYKGFSYIICDEIHSLFKFQNFSRRPNCHSVAREALERAVKENNTRVVALTATPSTVAREFYAPFIELPIDPTELIRYEEKEVIRYNNIKSVLLMIEENTVGLCYISRIANMIEFQKSAENAGLTAICIWSINNSDYTMNEEQMRVRQSILERFEIPAEYNLVIINASSETSLKIKSPVDYVIVNSDNQDTQIQVRGRVNGDLQTLYLPTDKIIEINVPDEYLNKRLFSEEKEQLVKTLNLRDPSNNRLYKWPTVNKLLIQMDYVITEGRQNSKRYVEIRPAYE